MTNSWLRAAGVSALVALVFVGAGAGVADVSAAGAAVSVTDGTVSADSSVGLAVTLSSAPAGVSGYKLRVTTADTSVASIAGVSVPDEGRFVTERVATDGSEGTVERVGVAHEVQPGDDGVRLATVTVDGVAVGETALSVAAERLDDDGTAVRPSVVDGTVAVDATTEEPDGSDGSGGAGGSGRSDGAAPASDDASTTTQPVMTQRPPRRT